MPNGKRKEGSIMAQNIFTGIQGNEFGRFVGQSVANQLGINLEPGSNKGIFKSRSLP
jgi:hypothetical protein